MRLVETLETPDLPVRKFSRIGEKACLIDNKADLEKYTSVGGRWRFVPMLWKNGEPRPDTILLNGKPLKRRGSGTFTLDWRETASVSSPMRQGAREALNAWRFKTLAEARPDALAEEGQEPDGRASIADAVPIFLLGVKGTKAMATFSA